MMGFLTAMFPARLYAYLVLAGIIFVAGGTSAWKVQAWRIDKIKVEHATQMADSLAKVNAAEQANQKLQIEAQNAKTKRDQAIKAAASATNTSLYSLRSTTASYIAKTTPAACPERITRTAVVFSECTAALTELAEKADRLNSDRVLLLDSWPK